MKKTGVKSYILGLLILAALLCGCGVNKSVDYSSQNINVSPTVEKIQNAEEIQDTEESQGVDKSQSTNEYEAVSEDMKATSETTNVATDEFDVESEFYIEEISDELFDRIYGKSYKEDCTVSRDELRYIHVLHKTLEKETKEGELICNVAIAEDLIEIFRQLYDSDYPIEKIRLVDEYDADDERSMADNNSSCFNFRFVSHTTKVSSHGKGLAVDINPLYNPYIKTVDGELSIEPANSTDYVDRDGDFPYKIDTDDLCYRLFTEHGFSWGGNWKNSKDYQHFEKKRMERDNG